MSERTTPCRRRPYGRGVYRRHIRLAARDARVTAELEDDFHRFGVVLEHDGERVLRLSGEARRYPWSTCPGATDPLARFAGMALTRSLVDAGRHTDPRSQCTHLFDLASLAVAQAAARRTRRRYEIAIPDRVDDHTHATLCRDGEPLLDWRLEGATIVEPEPFAGQQIWGGRLTLWAARTLEADAAEAALVLHRACAISLGRSFDLDRVETAKALGERTLGACYAFGPERIADGRRMLESTLDFTDAPELLLREDDEPGAD